MLSPSWLLLATLLALLTALLTLLTLLLAAGTVHLVEQGEGSGLKLVGLLLELLGGGGALARLALGNELAEGLDLGANLASLLLVEAVFELLEGLLSVVEDGVGAVGGLDGLLALLVGLRVLLGVLHHVLDLLVTQTGAGGNGDGLVLVGGLVLGVHMHNGIGVDVEGDLDLWNTTVCWWNTDELEVAEELVVTDELTLTLVDLDLDGRLEVGSGGEDLGLLGRDGGVAVDQTSEDTTQGLDTEGKRGDIEKKDISDLTGQNGTLDSGTNSDSLIRVNGLGGITTEDTLDGLDNLWHTSHTTDEDDLLDVLSLEVGILQGLADGVDGTADQRVDKLLKLRPGKLAVDVLWSRGVGSDERQVDVGLLGRGQLDLGLLSSLADTLDSHAVAGEVNALSLLELLDEVADEGNIEVLTTKVGVTVGGLDLEDTALDLKDGDIESTTAKIVNSNHAVALLLKTVSEGSSSRLVDNTEDVQTRNLTGVLGGLSLLVVEVCWNSDDGVLHGLASESLGSLLHLSENETADLRWRVFLTLCLEPRIAVGVLNDLVWDLLDVTLDLSVGELASDKTLCGEEGVLGVDDCLALCGDTNQTLALLGETDDGWSCPCTCRALSARAVTLILARYHIPSEFSMILGVLPSITATAELVVPRSIPMTWP